ncbi:hypothetical protein GGR53DRAFT_530297 [Hypoxylon sp. FL1150]|nr:hypothetical protein GGR53DRAFT_530297 [Hypoxylon sp. FL1150]
MAPEQGKEKERIEEQPTHELKAEEVKKDLQAELDKAQVLVDRLRDVRLSAEALIDEATTEATSSDNDSFSPATSLQPRSFVRFAEQVLSGTVDPAIYDSSVEPSELQSPELRDTGDEDYQNTHEMVKAGKRHRVKPLVYNPGSYDWKGGVRKEMKKFISDAQGRQEELRNRIEADTRDEHDIELLTNAVRLAQEAMETDNIGVAVERVKGAEAFMLDAIRGVKMDLRGKWYMRTLVEEEYVKAQIRAMSTMDPESFSSTQQPVAPQTQQSVAPQTQQSVAPQTQQPVVPPTEPARQVTDFDIPSIVAQATETYRDVYGSARTDALPDDDALTALATGILADVVGDMRTLPNNDAVMAYLSRPDAATDIFTMASEVFQNAPGLADTDNIFARVLAAQGGQGTSSNAESQDKDMSQAQAPSGHAGPSGQQGHQDKNLEFMAAVVARTTKEVEAELEKMQKQARSRPSTPRPFLATPAEEPLRDPPARRGGQTTAKNYKPGDPRRQYKRELRGDSVVDLGEHSLLAAAVQGLSSSTSDQRNPNPQSQRETGPSDNKSGK